MHNFLCQHFESEQLSYEPEEKTMINKPYSLEEHFPYLHCSRRSAKTQQAWPSIKGFEFKQKTNKRYSNSKKKAVGLAQALAQNSKKPSLRK